MYLRLLRSLRAPGIFWHSIIKIPFKFCNQLSDGTCNVLIIAISWCCDSHNYSPSCSESPSIDQYFDTRIFRIISELSLTILYIAAKWILILIFNFNLHLSHVTESVLACVARPQVMQM